MARITKPRASKSQEQPRIYVLDTCVLLHEPNALFKFKEHEIYIPLAVIDELDDIKTRKESVGWAAREVFRLLDGYTLGDLTTTGVEVTPEHGKLFVYAAETLEKSMHVRVNPDNGIIEAARQLKAKYPERDVIVVSKDTGLRVRAEASGVTAQNYRSDLIDEERIFSGVRAVEVTSVSDWQVITSTLEIELKKLSSELMNELGTIWPNEFIIFEFGDRKYPTRMKKDVLIALDKLNAKKKPVYRGIHAKNLEQQLALEVLNDDSISLVALSGAAGTGKTMLALAVGLHKIDDGYYDRIIVIKPLVPVGGKDIGALPGDKFDKIAAWLGPMRDNIEQLVVEQGVDSKSAQGSFEEMVNEGLIEVEAMAFIQGRSIPNSIIIVDEAQNLSPRECRMVVERCGKNSKIILLGDPSQVENPFLDKRSCGLVHAVQGSKEYDLCAAVTLTKVERSPLAAVASLIFKQPEAQR